MSEKQNSNQNAAGYSRQKRNKHACVCRRAFQEGGEAEEKDVTLSDTDSQNRNFRQC